MFETIKEKRKYKKYKQIIFVDGENVGYKCPDMNISDDMYFFIFTNNKSYLDKNMEIINIKKIRKNVGNVKNCLDFCLISHLSEIVHLIKNKEIIILSKDAGYDSAILYLKQKYPSLHIERYGKAVGEYMFFYKINELKKAFPSWMKLTECIFNKIQSYDNMDDLKKNLTQKQKKKFVYSYKVVPISNTRIHITYDVYTHLYKVSAGHGSGPTHYECLHKRLDDAQKDCERIYNELSQISKCFQSHEQYRKAKKMNLLSYVQEAARENQPLIYKLMEQFEEEKAIQLFNELVSVI